MLQRIQTIWLLLATISIGLLIYFPMWKSDSSAGMDALGAGTHLYLLLISALLGIIQFVSIFFFKRRKTQISLCKVAIVFALLFIIIFVLVFSTEVGDFSQLLSGFNIGSVLPLLAIIFNVLAIRNIKKDEAIVAGMNRLR